MSIRRGKRCPRAGLRVRHSGGDTGVVAAVPMPTGKAVTCVNAGKTSLVYVKLDSGQTIGLPRVELSKTKREGKLGSLADIFRVTTKSGAAPPFEVGKVMDVVPGDYLATEGEVALKRTEFTSPKQLVDKLEDRWAAKMREDLEARPGDDQGKFFGVKTVGQFRISFSKAKIFEEKRTRFGVVTGRARRGDLSFDVGNGGYADARPTLYVRRAPWTSSRGWFANGMTTLRLMRLAEGKVTQLIETDDKRYQLDDPADQQALSVWLTRVLEEGRLPQPVGGEVDKHHEWIDAQDATEKKSPALKPGRAVFEENLSGLGAASRGITRLSKAFTVRAAVFNPVFARHLGEHQIDWTKPNAQAFMHASMVKGIGPTGVTMLFEVLNVDPPWKPAERYWTSTPGPQNIGIGDRLTVLPEDVKKALMSGQGVKVYGARQPFGLRFDDAGEAQRFSVWLDEQEGQGLRGLGAETYNPEHPAVSEQHGDQWRIWRAAGRPSTFNMWGLKPMSRETDAPVYASRSSAWAAPRTEGATYDVFNRFKGTPATWQLSFEMRRPGFLVVLGTSYREGSSRGDPVYFTSSEVTPDVVVKAVEVEGRVALQGLFWVGRDEPRLLLETTISKEQREMLLVWLDEATMKGGLSGLGHVKVAPDGGPRWVGKTDLPHVLVSTVWDFEDSNFDTKVFPKSASGVDWVGIDFNRTKDRAAAERAHKAMVLKWQTRQVHHKPFSGLGSTDAEHATEFENARHELIGAVSDAERHLNSGMCRAAGALIDEAYVQYGRMRAEAMDAKSMSAAVDMHKTIRSVDEPFEERCVRAEPVSETYEKTMRAMRPGLAGVGDVTYPTRPENAVLLGLPAKVVKRAKRSR